MRPSSLLRLPSLIRECRTSNVSCFLTRLIKFNGFNADSRERHLCKWARQTQCRPPWPCRIWRRERKLHPSFKLPEAAVFVRSKPLFCTSTHPTKYPNIPQASRSVKSLEAQKSKIIQSDEHGDNVANRRNDSWHRSQNQVLWYRGRQLTPRIGRRCKDGGKRHLKNCKLKWCKRSFGARFPSKNCKVQLWKRSFRA